MLVDTIRQLGDYIRGKRLGGYRLNLEGSFVAERDDGPNLQFNGEIAPYKAKKDLEEPFGREFHTIPGWKPVYDAFLQQARRLLDGKHELKPTEIEASFIITATGSTKEITKEIEAVRKALGAPQDEVYCFRSNS